MQRHCRDVFIPISNHISFNLFVVLYENYNAKCHFVMMLSFTIDLHYNNYGSNPETDDTE